MRTWPIIFTIITTEGDTRTATFLNRDEYDPREAAIRTLFTRGVERLGGKVVSIAAA